MPGLDHWFLLTVKDDKPSMLDGVLEVFRILVLNLDLDYPLADHDDDRT